MTELRCSHCNKLLARLDLLEGTIEIKCPWCNEVTVHAVVCLELETILGREGLTSPTAEHHTVSSLTSPSEDSPN